MRGKFVAISIQFHLKVVPEKTQVILFYIKKGQNV